jgi:hypothetical protein
MEQAAVDTITDKKLLSAVLPCSAHSDGLARQSHSKGAVAFLEGADKGRASANATCDSQQSVKRSGMYPMQRRGSRKQTLSLNPEEREALENLIEEVIMDGMDDGVVDSDGSSTDDDDDDAEDKQSDSSFPNKATCNADDGTIAINAAKVNNSGGTAQPGVIGGKKYYPGQLKVALKHMSNLPPRFVRKLAKAQQYLDAASTPEVPARPTTIVGRIEEEEEIAAAMQTKDEGRLVLPVSSGGLSPVLGQQDRDKDRSKLKENKLKEAKKQIRTLLCDKDQYIDENASVSGNTVPVKACNTEVSSAKTESNTYKLSVIANDSMAGVAGPLRAENADKNNDTSVKNATDISNFISPRAMAARIGEAAPSVVNHSGQMQTFSVTPALSVNVPDFVPKSCSALPLAFGTPSAAPATSFTRFPHSVSPLSPMQPDAYGRPVPAAAGMNDPRYYLRPAAVPSQPASYYGMSHVYNTPPPTANISSAIVGELLPSASSLVQAANINGVSLNNSGSYSMPGQYNVQSYSGICSSPYLQHPSQSLQTSVFMSYPTSSPGKPVGYHMSDALNGTYGSVATTTEARTAAEFQYGVQLPSAHGSYTNEALAYAQFSGIEQGQQHLSRMSVSRPGSTVDFSCKPHTGNIRWPSGGSPGSSPVRPGLHQTSVQNARFAHYGAMPARHAVSSRNIAYVGRPVAGPGTSLPNYSVNNAGSSRLQDTLRASGSHISGLSPQQSTVHLPAESVIPSNSVVDSSQLLMSPQMQPKASLDSRCQSVSPVLASEGLNNKEAEYSTGEHASPLMESTAADVLSSEQVQGTSDTVAESKIQGEQPPDLLSVSHENCVHLSDRNVNADSSSDDTQDVSHCTAIKENEPFVTNKHQPNSGNADMFDNSETDVDTLCQAGGAVNVIDVECITTDVTEEVPNHLDKMGKIGEVVSSITVQNLVLDEANCSSTEAASVSAIDETLGASIILDSRSAQQHADCEQDLSILRNESQPEVVVVVMDAEHQEVQLDDSNMLNSLSASVVNNMSVLAELAPCISLADEVSNSEPLLTNSSPADNITVTLSRRFAESLMQMFAPENMGVLQAGDYS